MDGILCKTLGEHKRRDGLKTREFNRLKMPGEGAETPERKMRSAKTRLKTQTLVLAIRTTFPPAEPVT
ncbi:hypothetical protein HMPREF9413_0087 [Paenibacillus sp. HGF7]|nr:hypothetical protein HMPREF9413_0087 [Paenibacillus sp. HGF7]